MRMKQQPGLPDAYHFGRTARESGIPPSPPGHLNWQDRHWFAAGWNDRDLELKKCAA